jgi:transcriptional regulator with XRE-family HTH domain
MLNKKILGEIIKNQRKSLKMKQHEVSSITKLSRTYISDIERGRHMPSTDALSKLAICLDLDLNVLKMTEIQ